MHAYIDVYIFYTRVQILINRLDYPWVSSVRAQEFCKRCPGLPVLIVCMVSVDVKQHWKGERKKVLRDRDQTDRVMSGTMCLVCVCVWGHDCYGWVGLNVDLHRLWLWHWFFFFFFGQTVSRCAAVSGSTVCKVLYNYVLNGFTLLSFSCANVAVVVIVLCAERVYIVIFMFKCCYSFHPMCWMSWHYCYFHVQMLL